MGAMRNYAKMVQLVESGKYGKPQVINCYVNTLKTGEELVNFVRNQLCLMDGIIGSPVDKESVNFFDGQYKNGFVVREYVNKCLLRYTFASAPMSEREEIIVYATDGEVRLDGVAGKIETLIQYPDYDPVLFTDELDVDGTLDFLNGKIGSNVVTTEQMNKNFAIAKKIAGN